MPIAYSSAFQLVGGHLLICSLLFPPPRIVCYPLVAANNLMLQKLPNGQPITLCPKKM
jgi:hypothetical protein